jgi:uncharacterized membrane protein
MKLNAGHWLMVSFAVVALLILAMALFGYLSGTWEPAPQ